MKNKNLFVTNLLLLPLAFSLFGCKKEKVFYNVYFPDEYKIIGSDKAEENSTYSFSIDYPFSYQNNDLEVYVNGRLIPRDNHMYTVDNVSEDLVISINPIINNTYSFTIEENPKVYEFFSSINSTSIEANGNYSFGIKFWGGYDLANLEIKIDEEVIYPINFNGEYTSNQNYYFELSSINKDINVTINNYDKLTWYTFDLGKNKYYQQSVYASLTNIDTYRAGYRFLGWSLEKDNKNMIVSLPYKNQMYKDEVTLYAIYESDISNLEIPYIKISTDEIPISKEYTNASLQLLDTKDSFTKNCQIKVRGNSTATYEKKPYKIKFDESISLFGSKKFKTWVLIADYLDPSLIRNYTAFTLENYSTNLNFTHTLKHVELEIDGEYQGVYLLTDQVEESSDGRVNIKVPSLDEEVVPFLLERDKDGEGEYGVNYFTIGITNFIIKYPENPTKKQFDYIYNYISTVYSYITKKDILSLENFLDLDSLYDYVLINELMVNIDSNWKSGFMYKPLNGKLSFGPLWDFDWCFSTWTSKPSIDQEFLLKEKFFLLKREPKDFSFDWMIYLIQNKNVYISLINAWNNIRKAYELTLSDINSYYEYIENAGLRNYRKWYEYKYQEGGSMNYHPIDNLFTDQYNYVTNSLIARYSYLNELLVEENHKEFINDEFK